MSTPNQQINFTDSAVAKVYELIKEESADLKLRVFVTGGGCSGFQYGFEFVEIPGEMDQVFSKKVAEQSGSEDDSSGEGEVKFLVDPISMQYLMGAEIDYKEDVRGSQFVIRNPNAKTTCGCGSSFSA